MHSVASGFMSYILSLGYNRYIIQEMFQFSIRYLPIDIQKRFGGSIIVSEITL